MFLSCNWLTAWNPTMRMHSKFDRNVSIFTWNMESVHRCAKKLYWSYAQRSIVSEKHCIAIFCAVHWKYDDSAQIQKQQVFQRYRKCYEFAQKRSSPNIAHIFFCLCRNWPLCQKFPIKAQCVGAIINQCSVVFNQSHKQLIELANPNANTIFKMNTLSVAIFAVLAVSSTFAAPNYGYSGIQFENDIAVSTLSIF